MNRYLVQFEPQVKRRIDDILRESLFISRIYISIASRASPDSLEFS